VTQLVIRRAERSDARAIKDIYQCPNACYGTLQLPHPSVEMWEQRLATVSEYSYPYVAELDGEIVGNLGFDVCSSARRRHVATFGMGVKDHCQGEGVGSALLATAIDLADNWLNLKRLELTVYTDNSSAIALYKKFGFVIEGEAKAYAFRNGQYVDTYFMARLAASLA